MSTSDKAEWILYDNDLTTKLAILPVMSSHLYLEHNEPGSGEIKIPLSSNAASVIENGMFIECLYRGQGRGSFFVDNIAKTYANADENAGKVLSVSGRGGMALLEDAIIYDGNTGETSREFTAVTKASIFVTLVTEAQARGALASLTLDFDAVNDSASVAWTDSETYKLNVGTSLLDVLRQFAKTGIDFEMNYSAGGFILSAYKNGTGTDKSETIYFRTGANCEEVASDERGDEIKNVLYTKYKDGFLSVSDSTSILARRRREKLLSLELAQTAASATTYASAELEINKDPKKSISVRIYDGVNPRLFVDYSMGDYITLDIAGAEYRYRVLGIQADFSGDQFSNVVVELNSLLYENELRMNQDLDWLMNQWNTARDAKLLEVSYWADVGDSTDDTVSINSLYLSGNTIYIGGSFSHIGGIEDEYITQYDLVNGKFIQTSIIGGVVAPVYSICKIGTDIYFVGNFSNIYKYDGTTLSVIGSADIGEIIYSIATDGTNLFITGNFTSINGSAKSKIAKYTVATSTWSALSTGLNGAGRVILCTGSDVYVGGDFTLAGGVANTAHIAKWASGSWSALATGLDGNVYALALSGTDIVAGGAFTSYLSVYDGVAWTAISGIDNDVLGIAIYLTDIYITGKFTTPANYIARYSGGAWWSLAEGLNGEGHAIAIYNNTVFVGGIFTLAGTKTVKNLAAYFTDFSALMDHLENSSASFNMGAAIHNALASAVTDTDEVPFWEATANALRKITWANILTTIRTWLLSATATTQILFNDAGVVTGDAGLTFDKTTNTILLGDVDPGIPTSSTPGGLLQGSNSVSTANFLTTYGTGVASYITGLRGRGTNLLPTAVQAEDVLFRLRGRGYDSAGGSGATSAEIRWVANQTHTTTAHGARLELHTTPNDSTTLANVVTVNSNGSVTIAPTAPTDGTDLMKFTTERAWTLQQSSTAGNAMLEFFSDTAGKYVRINPNDNAAGGLVIGSSFPATPERLHVIGTGNIKIATETLSSTGYAFNRLKSDGTPTMDFGQYGTARTGTTFGISNAGLGVIAQFGAALVFGTFNANDLHMGTSNVPRISMLSTGPITSHQPINYAADAQASDTYVITLAPALLAYSTGLEINFKANTANTGAATLNVNGLGAKTIVKAVSTALANNDILAGMFCKVIYDGTNFVLFNPRTL